MDKYIFRIFLFLILMTIIGILDVSAQCPMCRIAAESNLEHGGSAGKGLNTGILYLLSLPYLFISILGFLWYKNRKIERIDSTDV